ncbi:MAG: IPTL-CTERM sorting domain-containing protein [Bacteroidales bacterium]|nr:IPTL-CTERM sorting domain-containing protein [Bacteroidales bacterium]
MKNLFKYSFGQLLMIMALILLISSNIQATVYTLDLALSGQKEVPANPSTATGILIGTYNDATNVLNFSLMFNGLSAPVTAAHFHGPAAPGSNAGVQIPLVGFPTGVTSGTYTNTFTLTPEQESQLLCGMWYVNIHTAFFPGGEIRSQLKEGITSGNISTLDVALTGQKSVPANPSVGTGTLIGTFNHATDMLTFTILFNGLTGTSTAAHFHGPAPAGVNAGVLILLAGFPTSVTSGMYSNSYMLTPTQKTQLLAGLLYVNIHSNIFPGGEIRGQLTEGTLTGNCPANIPTLSQWSLIILGLLFLAIGMTFIYRRQHSFAFAGGEMSSGVNASIFDRSLFAKIFAVLSGLSLLVLFASFLYSGNVTVADTIGVITSSAIVAFIVQLLILIQRRQDAKD